MSRVWSLTPFFNELDVFEIRLAELDPVVDIHVVAESTLTYSGDPKPLHFLNAMREGRFDQWRKKIRYVPVDDAPQGKDENLPAVAFHPHNGLRWARENWQRAALIRGCEDMKNEDIVLLSDADEIPSCEYMRYALEAGNPWAARIQRIYLPQYVMYLNWRWTEYTTIAICRFTDGMTMRSLGPQGVRETDLGERWQDGMGWHLSYMGGAEAIQYKIKHAAHSELDDPRWTDLGAIQMRMQYGQDMFDRSERACKWVPITDLPQYVQENPERFEHLLIEQP